MSRATEAPDRPKRIASQVPRLPAFFCAALAYSVYAALVCAAVAVGRPRLALAATCLALGISLIAGGNRRGLAGVLLATSPLVALSSFGDLAYPLVFLPPIAVNLGLATWFARSLINGRQPLISTFARAERGALEPDLSEYTRTLTGVWACFFVCSAAASAMLAAFAPLAVWGWFVAVGNHVAVVVFFIAEYCFRRWRFPHYRHASPLRLAAIVAAKWRPLRKL